MFLVPMTRSAHELARSFDRLFDDRFMDRFFAPTDAQGNRTPALDISESDQAYTVKLDMPGVGKDDIRISVDGNRVTVDASTSRTEEKKQADKVVYSERSVASYSRSFTLPQGVNEADTAAKLDNGVLTLTLPKKPGARSVPIKVD